LKCAIRLLRWIKVDKCSPAWLDFRRPTLRWNFDFVRWSTPPVCVWSENKATTGGRGLIASCPKYREADRGLARRLLYYIIMFIMAYMYQRRHGSQKATDDYGQRQRLSYGTVLVDCLRRFFQRFRNFLKQRVQYRV